MTRPRVCGATVAHEPRAQRARPWFTTYSFVETLSCGGQLLLAASKHAAVLRLDNTILLRPTAVFQVRYRTSLSVSVPVAVAGSEKTAGLTSHIRFTSKREQVHQQGINLRGSNWRRRPPAAHTATRLRPKHKPPAAVTRALIMCSLRSSITRPSENLRQLTHEHARLQILSADNRSRRAQ